jgi:hypothetical protein
MGGKNLKEKNSFLIFFILGVFTGLFHLGYTHYRAEIFLSLTALTFFNGLTILFHINDPLTVAEKPTLKGICLGLGKKLVTNWEGLAFSILLLTYNSSAPEYTNILLGMLAGLITPDIDYKLLSKDEVKKLLNDWVNAIKSSQDNIMIWLMFFCTLLVTFSTYLKAESLHRSIGTIGIIFYLLPLLWFTSMFFQVLLQQTRLVFDFPEETVKKTSRLYGETRRLFITIGVVFLYISIRNPSSFSETLLVFGTIGGLVAFPIWFLMPYLRGKSKLERGIQFLRLFDEKKTYSKKKLIQNSDFDTKEFEYWLKRYAGVSSVLFRPLKHQGDSIEVKKEKHFVWEFIIRFRQLFQDQIHPST